MTQLRYFHMTILAVFCFEGTGILSAQQLDIIKENPGSYIFIIDHEFHGRYGLGYPVTYIFRAGSDNDKIIVKEKHSSSGKWNTLPEPSSGVIYSDKEIFRYDKYNSVIYVSACFRESDSLFLEITDEAGNPVNTIYAGITKYYDNKNAVVTVSADDWFDDYDKQIKELLELFRSYDLYVTIGVTTEGLNSANWTGIQNQLDKGYVEIASHSRTHPFTPYSDPVAEVAGSAKDICKNLKLPGRYTYNGNEYVYVWIAPSGDYDFAVDSLLTSSGYLLPRLYYNHPFDTTRVYSFGDSDFRNWNNLTGHFDPSYPGVELGTPYWGGGNNDLHSLNKLFDSAVNRNGIYHPMWHPQVLYEDINKPYLIHHLEYISRRPDIWYVNLGPLYLYRLIQTSNSRHASLVKVLKVSAALPRVSTISKGKHPASSLIFKLNKNTFVDAGIYSDADELISNLIHRNLTPGTYELYIDESSLASGNYTVQLTAGSDVKLLELNR